MIMTKRSGVRIRAAARTVLLAGCAAGALVAATATSANAADVFTTPNLTTGNGPVNVNFSGNVFVNQGLVGAGRLSANLTDFNGDTIGSFSGMALDLTTWRRGASGYSGVLYTLPDRGYNDASFSNYAGRVHRFNIGFNPYYSNVNLPAAPGSQNQVTITPDGGFLLRDFNGNLTTGEDPGTGTQTLAGYLLPQVPVGLEGAGKVSLDAEALVLRPDGSFYVGDEYTGGIYYFNASGQMAGFIAPPTAIAPSPNFNSLAEPTTGRRNNQGMEAVSATPDGKTLFAVLQSSTVQDSTGSQQTRLNTRVMKYDISSNPVPTAPVDHYVLQLPTIDRDGTGGSTDRTAAQSEILALNGNQFLLLTRDGNGVDNGDTRPVVFKSIYLVDTTGATDIAGTTYETTTTPVAPGGALVPTVTPVVSAQFVNMLNTDQLTKFGLNLDADLGTAGRQNNLMTLSEKWEALALAPVLDDAAPQDFFLFVGNDNDFITQTGTMVGDAEYNSYDAGLENDSMLLVYRLTLPTYVDPQYLDAMLQTAPIVMAGNGESAQTFGGYAGKAIDSHLDALRQSGGNVAQGSWSGWMVGMFEDIDPVINGAEYTARALNGTVGVEYGLGSNLVGGLALSLLAGDVDVEGGFEHDVTSTGVSAYIGWEQAGWFAQASYGYAAQSFEEIIRPAAYGMFAMGETDGTVHAVGAKAGRMYDMSGWTAGPVIGASFIQATIDGYTETGAAGGNVTYPELSIDRLTWGLGLEATLQQDLLPTFRAFYAFQEDDGDQSALVTLASAQSAMGTQAITVPSLASDTLTLGLGIQSGDNVLQWHAGYDVELGMDSSDDITHRVTFGVRF